MKKLLIIFSAILFLTNSCGKKHFYEEYVEIPNNVWNVNEIVKFQVNIDDIQSPYDINLNIRHGYNYPYENLWLFIKTISPSGKVRFDTLECILTDENYNWIGSCAGDICDAEIPFADSVKFVESGTYNIEIQQALRQDNVPYIMEIGLLIDKIQQNEN